VDTEQAPALRPLLGLEPADDSDDELVAAVRSNAAELARREAGTRLGSDPEELHKFRVATRRTRSLLRSTRRLVGDPDHSKRLAAELKWLGSLLGAVRDRDVLIAYLVQELETLDGEPFGAVFEVLDREREAARRELVEALDSTRYRALVAELDEPPSLRKGTALADAAEGEYKRLRRTMGRLGKTPTNEELHGARILVKRARYSAEAAEGVGRFVASAKALQETLGEHQDAVVAAERVRALLAEVRGTGRTAFAAGRLVERQAARLEAARRDWPRAWKRLKKAGDSAFS
jgi:CHAD domain-containing protein